MMHEETQEIMRCFSACELQSIHIKEISVCDVPQRSSDRQELGVLKVHVTITALCSYTFEQDTGVSWMQPGIFTVISHPDAVSLSEPRTGL